MTSGLRAGTLDGISGDGSSRQHGAVHLLDAQGAQGARRQGHPRRRHARVPAGREDRRGRPQRGRQVQRAQDHGRARPSLQRGRDAVPGLLGRHPHAGAGAGREQGRPGQRGGGGRRDPLGPAAVRRGQRCDGRARRGLRLAAGRAGRADGADRAPQRLGARQHHRAGDGRAALPAGGCAGGHPVRRREAAGRAVRAAAAPAGPVAARRADQPPRRRERAVAGAALGEVSGRRPGRDPRSLLPRQRRRVDPRDRPRPRSTRTRATTRPTWRPSSPGSRSRAARTPSGSGSWSRSSSGSAATPRRGRRRARPGCSGTRSWRPRPSGPASSTSRRSRFRPARGWGRWSSRRRTWTRVTGTAG